MSWNWLRVIAVSEIIGGVAGMLACAIVVLRSDTRIGAIKVELIPFTFFLLSLFAGAQLFREKRIGYWASIIVQAVQFPKLFTAAFAFAMSFGFDVAILNVKTTGPAGYGLVFPVSVPEYHLFRSNGLATDEAIGFSIISCVNILVLLKQLKKMKAGRTSALVPSPSETSLRPPHSVEATQQTGLPDWVMPFWIRGCVIIILLLFTMCIGLQITFVSSPR